MKTAAERAAAIAKQARSARDAQGATAAKPELVGPPERPGPHRQAWFRVYGPDSGTPGVLVMVRPDMSADEVRATFYPDARSILWAGVTGPA